MVVVVVVVDSVVVDILVIGGKVAVFMHPIDNS